jgi:hypothetical protein
MEQTTLRFIESATRRFRGTKRALRALLAVAIAAATGHAFGAAVPVPNGDFSDPDNFGTVGGGLIGGSGVAVPIGDGPWLANYSGVLGLLAPPSLTIRDGSATINGLAAANILGILNNGASFTQTLPLDFEAGKRYTLSLDIDTGTLLDIGLLTNGNFGLSLWDGDVMIASTISAPDQLLMLVPLGGTEYTLSLEYDAVSTTLGPITVQLFADPQQLIGVSLLPTVTFHNARLDAVAINPVSGSIVAVDSTPQTATVAEPFEDPLIVRVTDVDGDPVPGATVTFAAPADGASATISDETVETDSQGFASVDATANTVAGSYTVVATVEGVDTPAAFSLTNTAGTAASTIAASGALQSAVVGAAFPQPLVVQVVDAYGNPVEGTSVAFDAPDTGASATFSNDTVATDANGLASVEATANNVVGAYDVTATVDGIDPPASFALQNLANDDGTTIDDGGGDDQKANIGGAFACAFVVHVNDSTGAPAPGTAVDFTAPDSGASATLSNGVVSGSTVRAMTDANGTAIVTATANDVAGDYTVSAQLAGAPGSVDFGLSNIEGLVFSSGFDTPCTAPTL